MKAVIAVRSAAPRRPRQLALFGEITYMWLFMRSLFLFPVAYEDTGRVTFRWRSRPAGYSIVGWLIIFPYIVFAAYSLTMRERQRAREEGLSLHDGAQLLTVALLVVEILSLPFFLFTTMPMFARMTASWERMEVMYAALTGAPPSLGIRRYSTQLFFTAQVYVLGLIWALYQQLSFSPYELPPLLFAVYSMVSMLLMWVASYMIFGALASGLARRFHSDYDRLGADGIRVHRRLWAHNMKLLRLYNKCWNKMQILLVLALFIMCTAYFFSFVYSTLRAKSAVDERQSQSVLLMVAGNSAIYSVGGLGLTFLCLAAHHATDSMDLPVRKNLLSISLRHQTEAVRSEVANFIEDLRGQKAVITLSGFLQLNRSRLVTMVVTCCTYMVVMSQFTLQD